MPFRDSTYRSDNLSISSWFSIEKHNCFIMPESEYNVETE